MTTKSPRARRCYYYLSVFAEILSSIIIIVSYWSSFRVQLEGLTTVHTANNCYYCLVAEKRPAVSGIDFLHILGRPSHRSTAEEWRLSPIICRPLRDQPQQAHKEKERATVAEDHGVGSGAAREKKKKKKCLLLLLLLLLMGQTMSVSYR